MKLYVGADHRGHQLKREIIHYNWDDLGLEVVELGGQNYDSQDDYVDVVQELMNLIKPAEDRAILLCGSGHGMDISANRFEGLRAILGFNLAVVKQGREHEDANVLVIPADWTQLEEMIKMIKIFIETPFSNQERHLRRLEKLKSLRP